MEPVSSAEQQFLKKLIDVIETNLHNEQFGVNELASELGMSRITLHRKVKSVVKKSVSEFIRETRLIRGYELLQQKAGTVSEIAYKVGFGSVTYFNRCFHHQFGFPPGEVLKGLHPDVEKAPVKNKQTLIQKLQNPKIFYIIPIVILLIVVVVQFIGNHHSNSTDKTIAVLPFKYLSNDTLNQYLADGMTDAILLNLSKIKDLRVISRTSVEQYRSSEKPAGIIGKELKVAYLLEGSFQKEKNQIRLIVQLIRTKDNDHVWSNSYDRNWKDIFSVQSEVAETIAGELQAAITPEEKQLIRKIPTLELVAYDFYQRGIYMFENAKDSNDLKKAKKLFIQCLEKDSTYASAYAMLAQIYLFQNRAKTYFSEDYLDSIVILADIAISYDDKCFYAYAMKGARYYVLGKPELAIEEFNKASELNPNDPYVYLNLGFVYQFTEIDFAKSILNYYEAAARQRGEILPAILQQLGHTLNWAGYYELANHYYKEKLILDGDSISYYFAIAFFEIFSESGYQQYKRVLEKDTVLVNDNFLHSCFATGHYIEAYDHAKKIVENLKKSNGIPTQSAHRIAYAFWMSGDKKEAEYYFNLQKKIGLESIEKGREIASRMVAYYDLAAVYTFEGDKENAYKYLEELYNKKVFASWWVNFINNDPLFDNIRNEPRFQAVVKHIENGYQAEHERVGKWLEEQGML